MFRYACAPFVRASAAAIFGVATLVGFSSQVTAAEAEEEEEELQEVQVTGTRIQLPNVTAANPVTSITGEEMRALGFVNVADALTTLVPQNISTFQPTMTGDDQGGTIGRGSFFIGNTIANLRGLDPMFGSRTLTMVDGRRVVSTSNQADVVDLNIIPSNLLQRMDVVTGGASATYGSGAMAGVVNLVLNNRLTGVNVDLDYGINEAGDGASPHVSVSGGMPLFGGRGHGLLSVEWQDQSAIRNCAAARDWCAESRSMFSNNSNFLPQPDDAINPRPGFEDYPARFEMQNVRYSQFSPSGAIYSNSDAADNTSGFRFTDDGIGVEEYAYGYRGGAGGNTMNGDGPLITTGTVMRPSTERTTLFSNFEYNFTERTTGYIQGNYATTDSLNRNQYTRSDACVRFDTLGLQGEDPTSGAQIGDSIYYGGNGAAWFYGNGDPEAGKSLLDDPWNVSGGRNGLWNSGAFQAFQGVPAPGFNVVPFWVAPGTSGSTATTPPVYTFANGVGHWRLARNANGSQQYWLLERVELTTGMSDNPGTPDTLPSAEGRNAYAFLGQLSDEALVQLQSAFDNGTTVGQGGSNSLWANAPCAGFTAVRKVWNPQIQQWTSQKSETARVVAGLKGRFGNDWRWETYYQYGQTDSTSRQNNVQTNLSFAFAMDAVIDDREFIDGVANPAYGQPVCRVTRDGVPTLDFGGRPLSDQEGLLALAEGCKPLNIFGTTFPDTFAGVDESALQQEALAYAFKENISDGANNLHVLSVTTSGSLWQGWAGPLTGAFGAEVREDKVDNQGSRGPFYLRADINRSWGDAFGGKTRVAEGYTELNMPLLSGMEGVNLLSVNLGGRYSSYHNKGGAGTTGASATQNVFNWKASALFEPFEFVRMRITRSRDLRAAGYRELFINQPTIPDATRGANPWRSRTPLSNENQQERWGTVTVGNPDLKPEKSDTLTLGLVLSPGGWAQGMRLSADYYDIRVKDGIAVQFGQQSPVQACFANSGNQQQGYIDGSEDPDLPQIGGGVIGAEYAVNDALPECQAITFGLNPDGTRNLSDIVAYNTGAPSNGLPYRRRGVDFSWNYTFPMNRAFESLPGAMSLTVRASRALESSGSENVCGEFEPGTFNCITNTTNEFDMVGQIRTSRFIAGVSASPKWTGNIITSYRTGDLSTSLSARYIGGAKLDREWIDDPQSPGYYNELGQILAFTVDNNIVKPYFNFSLNGSYDLDVGNMKQFQVFGSVNNLFDKSPPFTGGGVSGASAQYHDTMGRAYRMGVRMRF